ncbi:MAG: class I adenylate-forming enzyme family protein [Candidatus Theseobacter exili]|nr:class I adenylate-forming enzyme family protein [Candidatus Theseobacter exili]
MAFINKSYFSKEALIENSIAIKYNGFWNKYLVFKKLFISKGVRKKSRVVIYAENRNETICAFFALSEIGAVSILFDPRNPINKSKVQELKPDFFVGSKNNIDSCDASDCFINFDIFIEEYSNMKNFNKDIRFGPSDNIDVLCYQTSGTTGKPKEIFRIWDSIETEAKSVSERLRLNSKDRILCSLPICHSYMFDTIIIPAMYSGSSIFLSGEMLPVELINFIEKNRITVLPLTPTVYRLILRYPDKTKDAFSSVRLCVSAGSMMHASEKINFEKITGKRVFQIYGMTETGAITTDYPDGYTLEEGSVGKPFDHIRIRIDKQIPEDTDGVVSIKSFKNDQWIQTGDIGENKSDGVLLLKGRSDHVVKIAGEKVSLNEIEALLLKNHKIEDAYVCSESDTLLGQKIIAYISFKENEGGSLREISEYCEKWLPAYKIPRKFIFLKSINRDKIHKCISKNTAGKNG